MQADPAQSPQANLLLDVSIRHRTGTLAVDATFQISQPWTILFGPSGSGKTTILRAIAGLIQPDRAKITVNGPSAARPNARVLDDTSAGHSVAAFRRRIPIAPQSATLFPHMTVRRQIAYGMIPPSHESSNADDVSRKTDELLHLFRLTRLAGTYPHALSGGEAQRVNLARAAASASYLLLLDEPFAGLDPELRSTLMLDLQTWAAQRNLTVLSVTHDVAEAFQLGAEVIKLSEGRVVQQGPVDRVLAEDRLQLLRQLGSSIPEPSNEPYLSG